MNSLGVVLSPGGLAGAERSEGERSEPQRSAAPAKAGADSVTRARPDPEVVAKPKRRTYTAECKQRILEEAEAAAATQIIPVKTMHFCNCRLPSEFERRFAHFLGQFGSVFSLGLPNALKGCVNALSFGHRVAQFSTISPKCMPNLYELRFASLRVSVVVFLSGGFQPVTAEAILIYSWSLRSGRKRWENSLQGLLRVTSLPGQI